MTVNRKSYLGELYVPSFNWSYSLITLDLSEFLSLDKESVYVNIKILHMYCLSNFTCIIAILS